MRRISSLKKHLFSVYEEVYSLKEGIGKLALCKKCENAPCEEGPDVVVLLPFEAEFILGRLRRKGREYKISEVKNVETDTDYCPFLQDGRCCIHSERPIDCRSYPLTPYFTKNSFKIKLLRNCLYSDDLPKSFLREISATWEKILPFLPENWKKNYNKVISRLSLRDLPPHL